MTVKSYVLANRDRPAALALATVLFPPLALVLVWSSSKMSLPARCVWTTAIVSFMIATLALGAFGLLKAADAVLGAFVG